MERDETRSVRTKRVSKGEGGEELDVHLGSVAVGFRGRDGRKDRGDERGVKL